MWMRMKVKMDKWYSKKCNEHILITDAYGSVDILDCPRYASEDAPDIPRIMPQTCHR